MLRSFWLQSISTLPARRALVMRETTRSGSLCSSSSATAFANGLVLREVDVLDVERHVHLQPLGAGRLDEARQAEVLEQALQPQRHAGSTRRTSAGAPGSRSNTIEVGRSGASAQRERRVQLDRGEVGQPHERRQVVGERVVDRLAARGQRRRAHPVRAVRRRLLLEERLASTPSGQRVTVSARPCRCGSSTGATARVVVDHLALGEARLRVEHLVEVRQLQLAPADLGPRRLALALERSSSAPASESRSSAGASRRSRRARRSCPRARRARPACPRAGPCRRDGGCCRRSSTPRTRPRRRAAARRRRASRGGRSPAANGESSRRSGSSRRLQALELLLAEAGADAPDVAQRAVRLVDAEQQRADRRAAPALARQPAADDELLAAERLDLQPGAAAPPGLVAASRAAWRRRPPGAARLLAVEQLARRRPTTCSGVCQRSPLELELGEQRAALGVGRAPSASGRRATAGRRPCR